VLLLLLSNPNRRTDIYAAAVDRIPRRTRKARIALWLLLVSGLSLRPAGAVEVLPKSAEPVSAVELYMLYKDKTWQWEKGAGRFYSKDRRFLAWSDGENGKSYAEGRFILTDGGRVCMDAVWRDAQSTVRDRSCFLHHRDQGTIYQRKDGSPDWYLFRHLSETDTGEYAKFVDEDLVSDEVATIRKKLAGCDESSKGENDNG
jgi:Protein of unknown function (DUF995)